jgi:hypothetical protein
MIKRLIAISAFILLTAPLTFAQNKSLKTIPTSYDIEKNELQLSEAINKYRTKNKLGELQLSPSLSFVAKTHLNDIRLNSKDEQGCNLNSWSDKGNWKPCCFNAKLKSMDLMTSKPSEITDFRGKGFEIVIAAKKGISTKDLVGLWFNAQTTQDFLMNAGKWSNHSWQSIGVSIYKNFASIWASEMPDRITDIPTGKGANIKTTRAEMDTRPIVKTVVAQENEQPIIAATPIDTKVHTTEVVAETETSANLDKGTSYFLIHSSYTSLENAMKAFESLKNDGFKNLVMIDARGKYRVALGIYTTEEAAKAALRKFAPKYDQLIIYIF